MNFTPLSFIVLLETFNIRWEISIQTQKNLHRSDLRKNKLKPWDKHCLCLIPRLHTNYAVFSHLLGRVWISSLNLWMYFCKTSLYFYEKPFLTLNNPICQQETAMLQLASVSSNAQSNFAVLHDLIVIGIFKSVCSKLKLLERFIFV